MNKILAALVALLIPIGAMLAIDVSPVAAQEAPATQVVEQSSDNGVVVNFGACMSSIDPSLKPFLAPGKLGNGPFTIVNTAHAVLLLVPDGFDGGGGCTHVRVLVLQVN